jgi:hypothetical protein
MMEKVNWNAVHEYDCLQNYKVLQIAFDKNRINKVNSKERDYSLVIGCWVFECVCYDFCGIMLLNFSNSTVLSLQSGDFKKILNSCNGLSIFGTFTMALLFLMVKENLSTRNSGGKVQVSK